LPAAVDACVDSVLEGWRKNPDKVPKTFTSGSKKGKPVKTAADRRSLAWAICQASIQTCYTCTGDEPDVFLEASGYGPVIVGAAALNDPHISGMAPLEIIVRKGKEFIKAQILRFGVFRHPKAPKGKLVVNQSLYSKFIKNFRDNVVGRKLFLDDAHRENRDSYGDFVDLEQHGDGLFAIIDPTPKGAEAVKSRFRNYASAWVNLNWRDTEVQMAFSEFEEEDFIEMALQEAKNSQEGDMAPQKGKGSDGADPPAGAPEGEVVQLSREDYEKFVAAQAGVAELKEKHEIELKAMKETTDKALEQLTKEIELSRARREEAEERLHLEKVDLLIESLGKPDQDGFMLDKATLDLTRNILRGDPIGGGGGGDDGEGESEIRLSAEDAEPTVASVRSYYGAAVEKLARIIPRTVPASRPIEPRDRRPADDNGKAKKIQLERHSDFKEMCLAQGLSVEEAEKRANDLFPLKED
jgi:hypothetical protein